LSLLKINDVIIKCVAAVHVAAVQLLLLLCRAFYCEMIYMASRPKGRNISCSGHFSSAIYELQTTNMLDSI